MRLVLNNYWLGFSLREASSLVVTFFGVSSGGVRDELGAGELTLGSPISSADLELIVSSLAKRMKSVLLPRICVAPSGGTPLKRTSNTGMNFFVEA